MPNNPYDCFETELDLENYGERILEQSRLKSKILKNASEDFVVEVPQLYGDKINKHLLAHLRVI